MIKMGKYVVIRKFKDTNKKVYEGGDFYPHDGLVLNEERAEALATGNNKTGKVYIVEVVQKEEAEEMKEAEEVKEEKPKSANKTKK